MRCAVIGGGAWGTALANLLARNGHEVMIWAREPDVVASINERHENARFLPGHALETTVRATEDLPGAVAHAMLVTFAPPSHALRAVLRGIERHVRGDAVLAVASKGLEPESLLVMTDVVRAEIPAGHIVALSGPSFASEVALAGQDVYVEGVRAYSTLGWFADPVLNTFVDHAEIDLAQLLFHELGHQRLFVKGDTDFNEAFATAVGEEGVGRWLQAVGRAADVENYRAALERQGQFVRLVQGAREQLRQLYGETEGDETGVGAKPRKIPVAGADRRGRKAEVIAQLRRDYAALKSSWGGYAGYDRWFSLPLNNAQLNTVATYHDLVPGFQALLQSCGGDLHQFYAEAARIGKLSPSVRRARLKDLGAAVRPDREIAGWLWYDPAVDCPAPVEPARKMFGNIKNLR